MSGVHGLLRQKPTCLSVVVMELKFSHFRDDAIHVSRYGEDESGVTEFDVPNVAIALRYGGLVRIF
jgi:hypothetical protein